MLENIPMPREMTPDELRAAQLAVCANAIDATEAGMLLDMLGLK